MKLHAIVELEDGMLRVAVGGRSGRSIEIVRSAMHELADLSGESIAAGLRALSGCLADQTDVHVVLGERRVRHFTNAVPRMSDVAAVAVVVREARRLTNLDVGREVLVATEIAQRLPGGRFVLASSALDAAVWTPIGASFRAAGRNVVGLTTIERCLAAAARVPVGQRGAVLEVSGPRARFVLAEGTVPVQVRRFLVAAGGDASAEEIGMQLTMELPRTLDWLRETGHSVPSRLVLGAGVELDPLARASLAADGVEQIVECPFEVRLAEGMPSPGLATLALLERLTEGRAPASLLDPPEVHLPWSPARLAVVGTALGMAVVGGLQTWNAGAAWWRARHELRSVEARATRVEGEIERRTAEAVRQEAPDPMQLRLATALETRRPVSRLLADVSNATEQGLWLEVVDVASDEPFSFVGHVEGETRSQALAALARFSQRLAELPYLEECGPEEISEVEGAHARFRFRLRMTWRSS